MSTELLLCLRGDDCARVLVLAFLQRGALQKVIVKRLSFRHSDHCPNFKPAVQFPTKIENLIARITRAAGTIVTFYGGELKNKIEMFTAFGSDFAPAGPSVAFHSPLHTIDAGISRVLARSAALFGLCVQLLC